MVWNSQIGLNTHLTTYVSSEVFAARNLRASPLGFIFYHLAPYTVSPTDLVVRCSTWEGEGHKTNTHAYVTRTVCVDHIRKNTVTRKIVQLGVTVVVAKGIYTPSARDARVRVRLGLVALPFPSRASDDKIRGR